MKKLMRVFLIFVFFLMPMEVLALSCAAPDPRNYDLVFEGKVTRNEKTGSILNNVFGSQVPYKADFEVTRIVKGNLGKTQAIHYNKDKTWGPYFTVGEKPIWVYANCDKTSKKCTTGLCSYGTPPRYVESKEHYAVCYASSEEVRSLINNQNIKKHFPSGTGETLFTAALLCSNFGVAEYLISKHSTLADYPDKSGVSPIMVALGRFGWIAPEKEKSFNEIAALLDKLFQLTDLTE